MFAISPTLLAYGTFGGREGITKIDRRLVAKANLTMLQYADRRLFASLEGFEVNSLKPDTAYMVGADVLKIVAERVEFAETQRTYLTLGVASVTIVPPKISLRSYKSRRVLVN
jgi:hypothetical protein